MTEHVRRLTERDLWLARAVELLRPFMAARGLEPPERVVIHCGYTYVGDNGLRVLGTCSRKRDSTDAMPRIQISDELSDPVRILDVVIHELIHAADEFRDGHGLWFQAWARAFGLEGHPGTCAGKRLQRELHPIARVLGTYPEAGAGYFVDDRGRLVA